MASFTAATKKEAEYLAAEYAVTKKQKKLPANLTIGDAIDKYILSKENVLSPGTIREYRRTWHFYFELLEGVFLKDISNERLQTWVSLLSAKVSPKTVRNARGLLSSALDMFFPDFRIKTTLPQREKPDLHTPSDADVRKLLRHYSCSIMHALGVPDQYIMARGGWATDGVMKRVHRDTIDGQTQKFNSRIFAHFNDTGNTNDT